MRLITLISCIFLVMELSVAALADGGVAKPSLVLKETVVGLPGDSTSEVRVLTASFKPGDKTVTHTHDYPVTVYVVEGAFTLELKGQPPKTIKAGEAMVEPPNTEMTGYNRSAAEETKVVIFYVSTPDGPFLKPLK
ncbi:MAG: cupin domain-containing protein [Aestuariivirga sp.]